MTTPMPGNGGAQPYQDLVTRVRSQVVAELASAGQTVIGAARQQLVRDLIRAALDAHARECLSDGRMPLDPPVEAHVARTVLDALTGLGGLQPLLDNTEIENINIKGADGVIVRYADGRRERLPPVVGSQDELVDLVRTIAARSGAEERRFDRGVPRLSVQLPDGSRLFALMAVTERVCVSIRRHRFLKVSLDDLVGMATLTTDLRDLFTAMVLAGKNIVVSGGTGRGKTTFVRALAQAIPAWERLITVEDAYELALDRDPSRVDVEALQAREANIEGVGAIGLDELVRDALRMSPDRVIVGEVRGKESLAMCMAMSQGNDGSLATVHASSSRQALSRLAAYAMLAPEGLSFEAANLLIAGAVHFVIHLDQTTDGHRVVSSVREIHHADAGEIVSNELFRPGPDRRATAAAPMRTDTMDQLAAAGFNPDQALGW
ncbi:CpaF family protein [Virgisporangium aurantiacum]|uniref:Protein kinase n=1 Tax=Virgisporangium aurantiacum TaxID=175570 RepID=A0A8J3ZMW9_9ACTN|nr:ATPase, T2SS/T4P/T4SS family [Virgisporangium aurantiacum]GIJ64385.1 protein kinase [Virgisporangium aurantiacum]